MLNYLDSIYAKNLKTLMLKNNMNQIGVALNSGIHQQVISKLLRGEQHFTDEVLNKLSTGLKISKEDFLNVNGFVSHSNGAHATENSNSVYFNDSNLFQELIKSKNDTIKALQDVVKENKEIIALEKNKNKEKDKKIERRNKKIDDLKLRLENKITEIEKQKIEINKIKLQINKLSKNQ